MENEHRTAIKKELRVLGGYLRLVEYWLDADYPSSAHAVMLQAGPVMTSLVLSVSSAAAQMNLDFVESGAESKEEISPAGKKERKG